MPPPQKKNKKKKKRKPTCIPIQIQNIPNSQSDICFPPSTNTEEDSQPFVVDLEARVSFGVLRANMWPARWW